MGYALERHLRGTLIKVFHGRFGGSHLFPKHSVVWHMLWEAPNKAFKGNFDKRISW